MHSRNLHKLAIEIVKVTKGIAQDIFANIFNTKNNMDYDLLHFLDFTMRSVDSVYSGTNTISFQMYGA